jgi:hypothetical protein
MSNRATPMHPWGVGGPKTADHRVLAKSWFLEELQRIHVVTLACEFAGIDRVTAYRWKESDKQFSEAWDRAVERTRDIARMSIFQRGILGWDEPMVSQGQVVYEYEAVLDDQGEQKKDEKGKPAYRRIGPLTIHKWSDSLASLYARANLPEYKEKQQIDLTAQITTLAETAKDELLAGLASAIANEDKEQTHQG